MKKSKFCYQPNQYGGPILPCTLDDFNRIVDSEDVAATVTVKAEPAVQQPASDKQQPDAMLVFGHAVADYVNVLLPNGVPQGSRHPWMLSLANDLIILRDGDINAVRNDLLQLQFVKDVVAERGQQELESILVSAKKLMQKREQENVLPPQPKREMRRAIELVTGRKYNDLVREQRQKVLGNLYNSPDEELLMMLNRIGGELKKLMPRFSFMELLCHRAKLKHYIAATLVGGAFAMTLMTRSWYTYFGAIGRRCRLNCILELIGRMGSGKHILVDLYRILMEPIKKADKVQIDALNQWNAEHEQNNGSTKSKTPRPTGVYRCLPCESSAAAIRDATFFAQEEVGGEKVQLHVSIMDSELDNTLSQMKKGYMDISSLWLKAFHGEPQGAFLKTTSACVGEVNVVANFMYSGTEYALNKQVTVDNYGSGLPGRLTVVPMGDSNFEMLELRNYTDEDRRRDELLRQWSYKLDRVCGEIPCEDINKALYKWTAQRMEEAKENNSKAEEDLLKRVGYHAMNYSLPFIVCRHWDMMEKGEDGFWRCGPNFATDKYDRQLALLIANAQLTFQHYFFKSIAEQYYEKLSSLQVSGKHLQGHTALAYKRLPTVFTSEDVDTCYGYEGNKNSIYSCLKRLQDNGRAQRIRSGSDKGKYRKLE